MTLFTADVSIFLNINTDGTVCIRTNLAMNTSTQPHSLNPENWNVEYRQYLTQMAIRKVRDYQIAEDLVQETFIAAWKAKDRFRGECTEKTYLSGI